MLTLKTIIWVKNEPNNGLMNLIIFPVWLHFRKQVLQWSMPNVLQPYSLSNSQQYCWKAWYSKLCSRAGKPCAINSTHTNVGVVKGLCHMRPYWFQAFAVGTIWCIELEYEEYTDLPYVWRITEVTDNNHNSLTYCCTYFLLVSIPTTFTW